MMGSWFNAFIGILCLTALVENSIGQEIPKCPGPLKHYEALGCKPIYDLPQDKCAIRYDCDHLKTRPTDKCFVNGHTYNIQEQLKEEDAKPCDKGCICQKRGEIAKFNCAIVDCFFPPVKSNCYLRRDVNKCCPEAVAICPEKPEDRPTCEIDGKIYKDGESFTWGNKPCICRPGFTKETVESFCRTPRQDPCNLELRRPEEIMNNYPPVFYEHQSEQTDCGIDFRHQNPRDAIIGHDGTGVSTRSDLKCSFGSMTLSVGESLVPATDYDSVCIDCKCEIPPILTCRRRPAKECDPSVHDDFSKYHPIPQ